MPPLHKQERSKEKKGKGKRRERERKKSKKKRNVGRRRSGAKGPCLPRLLPPQSKTIRIKREGRKGK